MKTNEYAKDENMNPNIGITEDNRQSIAMELLVLLADEYLLYTKTKNAHWNIFAMKILI